MPELNDLNEDSPAKLSRRNVVVGAAWAAPVIVGIGAAPAAVASTSKSWTIAAPAEYINIGNANPFTVSGTGAANTTFTLSVTGLASSRTVTVDDNGDWKITDLDLSGSTVPQGTITFTPARTGVTFSPTTRTSTKDTVRPTFTAGNNNNGINRTLSGTVSADATVTLDPARGDITYGTTLTGTPPMRSWSTVKNYKAKDFVGAFTNVVVSCSDNAGNAASTANITLSDA